MGATKTVREKEMRRGFRIAIMDLESGEILVNEKVSSIVGGYSKIEESCGGRCLATGFVYTRCSESMARQTAIAAEDAAEKTKSKIFIKRLRRLLWSIKQAFCGGYDENR